MSKQRTQTNSGINLLRVIMMLQIVYGHLMLYGGIKEQLLNNVMPGGAFVYKLFFYSSKCPVFVMIALSGYFLVNKENTFVYAKRKIISTWKVMLFYSAAIFLLIVGSDKVRDIINGHEINKIGLVMSGIGSLLPVLSNKWYFMTNYLIVLSVMPFLNKALAGLERNRYILLIAIGFVLLSLWPALVKIGGAIFNMHYINDHLEGKSILDFVWIYCVGGYLKRFPLTDRIRKEWFIVAFFTCTGINLCLSYLSDTYREISMWNDNVFYVVQVMCLISFFGSIKLTSPVIDRISKVNIGVYLITEHHLIRSRLWERINYSALASSNLALLYAKIFCTVILIYCVCGAIEYIRISMACRIGYRHKVGRI